MTTRQNKAPRLRRILLSSLATMALLSASTPAMAQRADQARLGAFLQGDGDPDMAPAPMAAPATGVSNGISEGIVAIVNDGVITSTDLTSRIELALLSSGLPSSGEVKKRLMPQVLHALVDEQLQIQEGKKLDVTVTDAEIMDALARIAQENHIPGGDMIAYVGQHGVSASALKAQVKAALIWNKVIQREIRPRVDVGDDEVDSAIARIQANAGKPEYLVSEIYLAVDNPKDDAQVKSFADGLVQQIKGGAVFGAVARQFSQGTGAAAGGDIGWVQGGQLGSDIDKALRDMNAGDISPPIRTANGYHIVGVRDKRTIAAADLNELSVKLQQFFRPAKDGEDKEAILQEANALRAEVMSCTDLKSKIEPLFPSWRWQDLGEVKLESAPAWIADTVRDLGEGQTSEPLATEKGSLILVVCERKIPTSIDRKSITNTLGVEKMELQARRLLRDLRRSAYVDVKI